MKQLVIFVLSAVIFCAALAPFHLSLAAPAAPEITAPSAVLIDMSGSVMFEKNADDRLYIASVTKVMTMLLVVEALDAGRFTLDDMVTISAASMRMGGSTAYLAEGERYSVHDLLKAVAVASANDGAVALAELVSGSQEGFVALMNERAAELGMVNTSFKNCHGLDEEGHYSSARDVAVMSRELLKHSVIKNYTTIWMDSLRDGTFGLSNTNRLVRFYEGCTGLKTGSTSKARSCLSASAERGGMELIAVVLNAPTTDDRYESARKLLDFGFANYISIPVFPDEALKPIPVLMGKQKEVQPVLAGEEMVLVEKAKTSSLKRQLTLAENVQAPVEKGQKLGELSLIDGDKTLITVQIVAAGPVERISFGHVLRSLLLRLMMAA